MYVLGNNEEVHACIDHVNGIFKSTGLFWPLKSSVTIGDEIFQNGKQLLMKLWTKYNLASIYIVVILNIQGTWTIVCVHMYKKE